MNKREVFITFFVLIACSFEWIKCNDCWELETIDGRNPTKGTLVSTIIYIFDLKDIGPEKLHESILGYFKSPTGKETLESIIKLIFEEKKNENDNKIKDSDGYFDSPDDAKDSDGFFDSPDDAKDSDGFFDSPDDAETEKKNSLFEMLKNLTDSLRIYVPPAIEALFQERPGKTDSLLTEVIIQLTGITPNADILEYYIMPVLDILWKKYSNEIFGIEFANIFADDRYRELLTEFIADVNALMKQKIAGKDLPDTIAKFIITQMKKPQMFELLETLSIKVAGIFMQGDSSIIECSFKKAVQNYLNSVENNSIQMIFDMISFIPISSLPVDRIVTFVLDNIQNVSPETNGVIESILSKMNETHMEKLNMFLKELGLKISLEYEAISSQLFTQENISSFLTAVMEEILKTPNLIERLVKILQIFGKSDSDVASIFAYLIKTYETGSSDAM